MSADLNAPFRATNEHARSLQVSFFHPLGYLGLDEGMRRLGYFPMIEFQAWTDEGHEPGFNLDLVMQ